MGAIVDNNTRKVDFDDEMHKWLYGSQWGWVDDGLSKGSTCTVNTKEISFQAISVDAEASYEPVSRVIPSVWTPSIFDCIDDLLLNSFFRDTSFLTERAYHYGRGKKVVVKVTATTLPRRKSRSKGEYMAFMDIKRIQKSISTFVGEIHTTDKLPLDGHLKQGTMVTSIQKCPADAHFMSLPVEALVALPPKLDPGESASIVSTYLPAFAILHHGCSKRENRYSVSALRNYDILLVGGDSTEQEALIKLSFMGGARKVTVLNTNRDAPTLEKKRFGRSNLVLLDGESESELQRLSGSIDLVIDLAFPLRFHFVRTCIKPTGRLVARKNETTRNPLVAGFCSMLDQAALFMVEGAYLFDFDCICANEHGEVLRDLKFLFRLLSMRKIRPNINKYIARKDIPKITEEMRIISVSGEVICESR